MNFYQKASERFVTNDDYRQLGAVIFGASQAYLRWNPGVSFQDHWKKNQQVPYAWEIIQILNQPNITVDELWTRYHALSSCEVPNPYALTEAIYKSYPDFWKILITLVNALRYTITPAHQSY